MGRAVTITPDAAPVTITPDPQKTFNEKLTEIRPWPKFDEDHPVESAFRIIGAGLGNLGAGAIAGTEGMASFTKDVFDPRMPLDEFYRKNIATIPDALHGMAQAVKSGHPEYVAGQLIPAAASAEFGGDVGKVADKAKESLGEAVRKPTGSLKPVVRSVARLGGAMVGGELGGGTGAVAGALAGPGLADILLPEHPNPTGLFSKIPNRMPKTPAAPPVDPFAGTTAPTPQGFIPKFSAATPSELKFVSEFEKAEPSKIAEPGSTPPEVKVTYQSIPQRELYGKVIKGDTNAIAEWQRRGLVLPPNVGFMVERGASPTPWRNYTK